MNWLKNLINFILCWFKQANDSKVNPVSTPILESGPLSEPPTPPPVVETLTLFDLPQTAVDMFQAGFPGRDGVLLYALGQVANDWPIPGQSHELILIASYYDKIGLWYEARINEIKTKLNQNPGLSVIIIGNDQINRFGCRIGPATAERLKEFGDRVQMGTIVPESEY